MWKIFGLLLLLIVGIIVGPMLAGHQGYVLIQTDNYNLETSLTVLICSIIIVYLLIWLLLTIISRIIRAGSWTHGWFFGLKFSRARKQTRQALLKLAEGDYQQAAKLFSRNAESAEQPVVNYLLAAESAQNCGDTLKANEYVMSAAELAGSDQFLVNITRAKIQLAQKEYHAARHTVDELLNQRSRHPQVLRLAEQAYLKTGAYQSLLDIIPRMYKIRLTDERSLAELEQRCYFGIMHDVLNTQGTEGLNQWWKQQSRKVRHDVELELEMARLLIESDDHVSAQAIIIDSVKRAYDPRLIALIPQLKMVEPEALEKLLRQQLRNQDGEAILYSSLAQLLMREAKWSEAQENFVKAIAIHPSSQDYALLADTLDRLNEGQNAAKMRQQALALKMAK